MRSALVDSDQSGAADPGSGRSLADRREHAADQRDQAGDAHDEAAEQRDLAADDRDHAGDERDIAGDARDQAGDERDLAAERRDQAAEQRDAAVEQSEVRAGVGVSRDSGLARAAAAADRRRASQDRRAGAGERSQAGRDRDSALADRGAGACERSQAEVDRRTALADRGASAQERASAFFDDLTGVYVRGAGLMELEREIARARRSELPLVLAFVDVDHLKVINDSLGHAAGDRLLLDVANSFRGKLRSHDLIIRYGGDEFVCAFAGLDMSEATTRLALITAALAAAPEHGSVTVGLAQLREGDSPAQLVARADAALYTQRRREVSHATERSGRRTVGSDRRRSPALGHRPERRTSTRRAGE